MARRSSPPTALVAAASRKTLAMPGAATATDGQAGPLPWQREVDTVFDEVSEVKSGVWYMGNTASKLRLFAAVRPGDDPEAEPVPVSDEAADVPPEIAAAAEAEMARLANTAGGMPGLQAAWTMNIETVGDFWLVGWGARDELGQPLPAGADPMLAAKPERWEVRSIFEAQPKEVGGRSTYEVAQPPMGHSKLLDLSGKLADGTDHDGADTIIRVYTRHPLHAERADSHLRACLVDCKALRFLTNQVLVEAMSAMPADILLVPNELTVTRPQAPNSDGSAAPPPGDPFADALDAAFTASIENPTDLSAVRHMVIRGPGEHLVPDKFRTVSLARERGTELEARIKARVERLARALNMPVEKMMGHQQTTFANAEQVDQDDFEDYHQPRAETMCDGVTSAFLQPNMLDAGHDPQQVRRIICWYDPSRLVAQPDVEKNADEAYDRNTISDAAYRRAKGFSDDDAPEPLDLLIKAGLRRGILTADLTKALLDLLGVPIEVEPLPELPAEASPADQAAAQRAYAARVHEARMRRFVQGLEMLEAAADPAKARAAAADALAPGGVIDTTGTELAGKAVAARAEDNPGRRLLAIDQDMRTRLQVAADAHLTRGLDVAGARLKSRAKGEARNLARQVPRSRDVPALLGPRLVAAAGISDDDLLAGAFDALEDEFRTWAAGAQAEALAVVNTVVGGFTTSERDALQLRQAADLDEAWQWLQGALHTLAKARLYDPNPSAPDLGEFDPTSRVPTGLVRQAVAEAGGAAGISTFDGQGAYITLQNGGSRPAGGIGTGELLRDAMRDHGVQLEAWRWVYGPARRSRPFEPHVSLDGVVFQNFDDPVLSNDSGWPEFAYYLPGDHAGCACDVEPIIVTPDELS